jgi:hypothetical protein
MIDNAITSESREPTATEIMFRDAERRLDDSLEQALAALRGSGVLWIDQSYRKHAFGSFTNTLTWRYVFTRAWVEEQGSACVLLDLSALEPMDVSWGVPVHWRCTTFSEPRILLDRAAHRGGNLKLDEAIAEGLETLIFRHIREEAKRVGREL